ncbi:MAG: aldose-1-epimerase [Propionibacteriales bacterium]|nr:aldose-1-epimerase [Propionibacteriales bacterium]
MDSPSGQAAFLRSGGYEAEVVEVGGGLRALRRDGDEVVAGYRHDEMCTSGRGQVLVPWPNRIEDGSYAFGGTTYQLGLTEAAARNAIHGLTRWVSWHLADQSPTRATWTYRLHPQPGYPFMLDLSINYDLSNTGLRVDISARNAGDQPAPYGHGAHPYLTVGRRIDGCELTLPASTRCDVDDRGLPGPAVSVDGGPYDFRRQRLIADTAFDHPFGGLPRGDAPTTVTLRDPDSGRAATLTADAAYPWLQVFSGDALPSRAREALAVEPMTCPPNAFRSGVDLVVLEPGESHSAGFVLG